MRAVVLFVAVAMFSTACGGSSVSEPGSGSHDATGQDHACASAPKKAATATAGPRVADDDSSELGGWYRVDATVDSPMPGFDMDRPLPEVAELGFDRESNTTRVSLHSDLLRFTLNLESIPDGPVTGIAVTTYGDGYSSTLPFDPQRPLPWLNAPVGTSASSTTIGEAFEVAVARHEPNVWSFEIIPTGQARDLDHFRGMVSHAKVCLWASAAAPPWNALHVAMTVDTTFGRGQFRADLTRVDADDIYRQDFYEADGELGDTATRLMRPHPDPESAVREQMARRWPGLTIVDMQETTGRWWHEQGAQVRRVVTTGEPVCVEHVVAQPPGSDGWIVANLGHCGFADVIATQYQQLREQAEQQYDTHRDVQPTQPDGR